MHCCHLSIDMISDASLVGCEYYLISLQVTCFSHVPFPIIYNLSNMIHDQFSMIFDFCCIKFDLTRYVTCFFMFVYFHGTSSILSSPLFFCITCWTSFPTWLLINHCSLLYRPCVLMVDDTCHGTLDMSYVKYYLADVVFRQHFHCLPMSTLYVLTV